MKHLLLFLLPFIFVLSLNAQRFPPIEIAVEIENIVVKNAWAGGLNSPQFSAVDLNNDEKPDLYIFDRKSNFHLTFLNEGTLEEPTYTYAPKYARWFPIVYNFALLRDFNQDGIMDLFAHALDEGIPGYKVYRGKFENDILKFDRVEFNDFDFNVLNYTESTGELTYIYTSKGDYPAIDDLDGDGDLDILANQGDSHLFFFKNLAIEQGFTTDTLIFELADDCWGKFYIDASGEELSLSDDANVCSPSFTGGSDDGLLIVHGGSTVTTLDLDNDGNKELLYGDATNPRIICAKNNGSPTDAWITGQDTEFPNNDTPIYIRDFAATFNLDVDGDGLKDIIASPNLAVNGPDIESAWFYKNITSNEAPQFQLQKKNFLVDEMIDLGTGAHPAAVDYNGDGLVDLVVGNDNKWQSNLLFQPSLFLFENTGTIDNPQFELVDDNWLNFGQFSSSSYAFAPTFGDLDNDGDLDLLVGERFGTLFYAENTAGAGNPLSFGPIQVEWKDIDVGQFATPFISDLNHDNKPDLIIGERNTNINYFPNQGSSSSPNFHANPDEAPNNNFLGQMETAEQGEVTGSSTPFVLQFNETAYIVTGAESGRLKLYIINDNNLSSGSFTLASEQWGKIQLGKGTHPTMANLDNDAFIDVIVGNSRGGLGVFTTNLMTNGVLPVEEVLPTFEITIFPNPVNNVLQLNVKGNFGASLHYRIFNSMGQPIVSGNINTNHPKIDLTTFNSGVYFLELKSGQHVISKKIIKQ